MYGILKCEEASPLTKEGNPDPLFFPSSFCEAIEVAERDGLTIRYNIKKSVKKRGVAVAAESNDCDLFLEAIGFTTFHGLEQDAKKQMQNGMISTAVATNLWKPDDEQIATECLQTLMKCKHIIDSEQLPVLNALLTILTWESKDWSTVESAKSLLQGTGALAREYAACTLTRQKGTAVQDEKVERRKRDQWKAKMESHRDQLKGENLQTIIQKHTNDKTMGTIYRIKQDSVFINSGAIAVTALPVEP